MSDYLSNDSCPRCGSENISGEYDDPLRKKSNELKNKDPFLSWFLGLFALKQGKYSYCNDCGHEYQKS